MAPATKGKGRGKRPAPTLEPELANHPKSKRLAKLYKDLGKELCDYEQSQENTDILVTDLRNANAKIHSEEDKNINLQGQIAQYQKELKASKRTTKKLVSEAEELKVDLLKHQPMSQLTDTHIAEMYEGLRGAISSWVDNEVFLSNDGCAQSSSCDLTSLASEHVNFLAGGYKYGSEYLAESIILHRMHELLYSNDLIFFGLDIGEMNFLHSAEKGLMDLDPPRDNASIRYLVSEILKGFTASELFDRVRMDTLPYIGKQLLDAVDNILPGPKGNPDRKIRFEEHVFRSAVEFATAMKTSATVYDFDRQLTQESWFTQLPLSSSALNDCTLINIDTRETIKADKARALEKENSSARKVLLLAPGLLRCDPGKQAKRLTTDVFCISVNAPIGAPDVTLNSIDQESVGNLSSESSNSSEIPLSSDRRMKRHKSQESVKSQDTIKSLNPQAMKPKVKRIMKGKQAETLTSQPGRRAEEAIDLCKAEEKEIHPQQMEDVSSSTPKWNQLLKNDEETSRFF